MTIAMSQRSARCEALDYIIRNGLQGVYENTYQVAAALAEIEQPEEGPPLWGDMGYSGMHELCYAYNIEWTKARRMIRWVKVLKPALPEGVKLISLPSTSHASELLPLAGRTGSIPQTLVDQADSQPIVDFRKSIRQWAGEHAIDLPKRRPRGILVDERGEYCYCPRCGGGHYHRTGECYIEALAVGDTVRQVLGPPSGRPHLMKVTGFDGDVAIVDYGGPTPARIMITWLEKVHPEGGQ